MKKRSHKRHFWKSMRFRIILTMVLIGLLPFPLMFFFSLRSYESRMTDVYLSDMLGREHVLADRLSEGFYWNKQNDELEQLLVQHANENNGRTMVIDQTYAVISDSFGTAGGKTMIDGTVTSAFAGKESADYDSDKRYMHTAVPVYGSDNESVMAVVWSGVPTTFIDLVRGDVYDSVMMMLIGLFAVMVLLIYILSALLVRPWYKLAEVMNETATGSSSEEVAVNTYNETIRVSDSFNLLKNRYEVIDNSRREFVANVSHELKTPIASMKVLADSILLQQDAPVELYQEFMKDIGTQLDRETTIIDDLLALVKLDKRSATLRLSDVNINNMIENLIKQLGPLAAWKDVSITLESHRSVTAHVDEVKLSLACMNVLENAIKYNKPSGSIKVTLDAQDEQCIISFADTGIGIPQEEIEKVFERFYRVDKSHSQQMGGSGLGLSIVRQAVEIQGGHVTIESAEDTGTVVTVRVPLNVDASVVKQKGGAPA